MLLDNYIDASAQIALRKQLEDAEEIQNPANQQVFRQIFDVLESRPERLSLNTRNYVQESALEHTLPAELCLQ